MTIATSETRLNLSAGILSVAVALTLTLAKLWAFVETGALSVAASLADSALDLMVSAGGLMAIAYAAKPADEDHAFGHSSAEDLAALGQSLFILASAAGIVTVAVLRLAEGDVPLPQQEAKGLIALGFSIALTAGLVLWQRHVAGRTGNKVVAADSLHYIGDLIPNLGAVVALAASAIWGIGQIDSWVAIGAAILLAVGAVRIAKDAIDALMDRRVDPAMIAGIEEIARKFPGVHGFHDLKTRQAGSRVFVNLHIELDGRQSLSDAHAIGAALKRAIVTRYPQADVLIHKDPVGRQPQGDPG